MKRILSAISSLALLVACSTSQPAGEVTDVQTLQSPDGVMEMTFQLTAEGTPQYALNYDGKKVILPSDLGFELRGVLKAQQLVYNADGTISKEDREPCNSFYDGFSVESVETATFDETWEPVWGQFAEIRNNYNSLTVTLSSAQGRELKIEMRLFNDGLGLRYQLEGEGVVSITGERTEFNVGGDYEAHWIAGSDDDAEFDYMHTSLSEITPETMQQSAGRVGALIECGVSTPIAMKSGATGNHLVIHEAALWHYPGMILSWDGDSQRFTSLLAGDDEVKSEVELPFSTPWRTVIVGDCAGDLVESNLILNLNEPCKLEDTSWIKPMKYVGVWWEMHLKVSIWDMDGQYPHCATTENVKRYIDFAAENGFGGVLVEGWNVGWGRGERFDYAQPYPDFDIVELSRYAEERGVELIGHHETYANVSNYEEQMLAMGRYPEFLKMRVSGPRGHLSNQVTAKYLASHFNEHLKNIWLCHLSEENNHPELAYKAVVMEFGSYGIIAGKDVQLNVLKRTTPSPLYILIGQ